MTSNVLNTSRTIGDLGLSPSGEGQGSGMALRKTDRGRWEVAGVWVGAENPSLSLAFSPAQIGKGSSSPLLTGLDGLPRRRRECR